MAICSSAQWVCLRALLPSQVAASILGGEGRNETSLFIHCFLPPQVAASILRGEGFTYTLPNRSKGNQLYVPGAARHHLDALGAKQHGLLAWTVQGRVERAWMEAPFCSSQSDRASIPRTAPLKPSSTHPTITPNNHCKPCLWLCPAELDRIVLKDSMSHRAFANTATCRKVGGAGLHQMGRAQLLEAALLAHEGAVGLQQLPVQLQPASPLSCRR